MRGGSLATPDKKDGTPDRHDYDIKVLEGKEVPPGPQWRILYRWLVSQAHEFHHYDTVYVVADNRDLVAAPVSNQPGLAHWPAVAAWWTATVDGTRCIRRYRLVVAQKAKLRLSPEVSTALASRTADHRLTASGFFPCSIDREFLYGYAADGYRSPLWICAAYDGDDEADSDDLKWCPPNPNAQDDPTEEELVGAAEKLDTMMAKVQPPLTSSLHLRILVRCRLVAPGQIDYLPGPLPREVC